MDCFSGGRKRLDNRAIFKSQTVEIVFPVYDNSFAVHDKIGIIIGKISRCHGVAGPDGITPVDRQDSFLDQTGRIVENPVDHGFRGGRIYHVAHLIIRELGYHVACRPEL